MVLAEAYRHLGCTGKRGSADNESRA